ncbi:MAG: hypothetical protein JSW10_02990 [Pseudomonadota bacterium]|nr:MAG: hypothetical protein JSW10_02990 [Pseudomonadota bacterium]
MSDSTRVVLAGAATALVVLSGVVFAQVENPQRGRLLYENHCTGCHDSVAHTRASHKATNTQEVRAQVARWASELKLHWSTQEIGDVSRYVAGHFYDFGAVPAEK